MSAPLLAEGTVTLIRDSLKSGFLSALNSVSATRADNAVSLEEPREYFIYDVAKMYQKPAVFIICDDFDQHPDSGQNFIYATAKVIVSVVCEDQTSEMVTLKLWRYTSALFDLLNLADFKDPSNRLKLHVIIKRQAFSDTYSRKSESDDQESVFSKEVVFELEVVHQEQF